MVSGMTYHREDPVLDQRIADEVGAEVLRRLTRTVAVAMVVVATATVLIRRTRTR